MRTAKYTNADTLLDNCTIHADTCCWTWPEANLPIPQISPTAPMAKLMGTNSVTRILFCILRHPPACRRLVPRCSTPFCVNPYHHAESYKVLRKRKQIESLGLPFDTPIKDTIDRSVYPDDDVLRSLVFKNPVYVKALGEAAMRAGTHGNMISRSATAPRPKIKIAIKRNIEKPVQRELSEEDKKLAEMDIDQIFDAVMMKKKRKMIEDWDDSYSTPKNGAGA